MESLLQVDGVLSDLRLIAFLDLSYWILVVLITLSRNLVKSMIKKSRT
jgi:hypothetical protein